VALFAFVMCCCPFATAQTVVFTDRGQYSNTGFHNPTNPNYVVGDGFGNEFRNFFVFDLSSVVQPIASAKLALFVPSAQTGPGYNSADPSENYELHDVTTSLATLTGGTGGVAAFTDLGGGVVYGSRTMTAADQGTVVEITLNAAAIAQLDAATGLIGIGGSLTTLDGVPNAEFTFGSSGSVGDISELRLTLVPEPSNAIICIAASLALIRRVRSRVS
jgi:hypothetical protein